MSELEIKYQKLASEYSRLRAQIPVLKKGVLEEQEKQKYLKNELREKDQSLRLSVQENDSLLFRNKQLVTRVDVLVSEREQMESKKNSKLKKSEFLSSLPDIDVLSEELNRQIVENRDLRLKASEIHELHRENEQTLKDRIKVLESPIHDDKPANINTISKENKILKQQLSESKNNLIIEKEETNILATNLSTIEQLIGSLLTNIESCLLFTEDKSAVRSPQPHTNSTQRCTTMLRSADNAVCSVSKTLNKYYSIDTKSDKPGQHVKLEDRLSNLQKERDSYKLEVQLEKMKLEKLRSQIQSQKEISESIIDKKAESGDKGDNEKIPSNSNPNNLREDESSCEGTMSSREEHIRNYYTMKIEELTNSLQMVDSKAIYFHGQYQALQMKLSMNQKSLAKVKSDLVNCNLALDKSKSEVDTTIDGYSSQFSIMNEHVTTLNQTISNQSEEIDELKYRLTIKN